MKNLCSIVKIQVILDPLPTDKDNEDDKFQEVEDPMATFCPKKNENHKNRELEHPEEKPSFLNVRPHSPPKLTVIIR